MEWPSRPHKDAPGGSVTADETERLRATIDQLTRERDAALASAEAKATFVAHISHELRTPMNGILGMTRLALDSQPTSEQRECLDVVLSSANALLTLINDLLDHAKIDSGKLEIEAIPFRLRDVVTDTVKALEVGASDRGLTLTADIDPAMPEMVVGDPTRFRQVLVNLVGNAIKFTETGGIEVRVVAPEPHELDMAHIAVTDTGIGIPSDRLEAIFEAFEQADRGTTRRFGGTGLGLSITARLIELMGGRIWVESEPGSGSTFRFTLPLPQAEIDLYREDTDTSGVQVLVVADSPLNRATIIEVLAEGEMHPRIADDVDEALRRLEKAVQQGEPYGLVVCDVQERGMETAERLVTAANGTPVVLLITSGQRGDAAVCRRLGIAAYLTGAPTAEDLTDTFTAVLAGEPTLITRHWLRERRRSLRILVADDSPTNRLLAIRLLEKEGHSVKGVDNGAEAVAAVSGGVFDVVLMDIHMPVLDGYDATSQIRAMPGARAGTPIIALTGSVDDSGRRKCIAAGMDRFIGKPFKVDELLGAIRDVTSS